MSGRSGLRAGRELGFLGAEPRRRGLIGPPRPPSSFRPRDKARLLLYERTYAFAEGSKGLFSRNGPHELGKVPGTS
jgi:hypothetical protein